MSSYSTHSVGTVESNLSSANTPTNTAPSLSISHGIPNFNASLNSMDILTKPATESWNNSLKQSTSYLPGSMVWQTYTDTTRQQQQQQQTQLSAAPLQKSASESQYSYSDQASMDSLMNQFMQMNAPTAYHPQTQPQMQAQPSSSRLAAALPTNFQRPNDASTNYQQQIAMDPWKAQSSATDSRTSYVNRRNSVPLGRPMYSQAAAASMANRKIDSNSSGAGSTVAVTGGEDADIQVKLQLKDVVIAQLQEEVERSNKQAQAVASIELQMDSEGFEIPRNHEQLYRKLVEKLQITEKELEDTKTRLEALVTAIALNPSQSQYKYGRYDEQEIAHKIITKLKMLSEENEELSKMLSYGKAKEKDIEIGLLRAQNSELREKLLRLENKGDHDNK
ncbi:hypothetical protein FOA43_000832 [Brettanomyces nanus]|uniref:Protein MUM2 n=1 Tax=Eeniella nana TaxID=13502 RepID=A0A875RWC1_EENNA|nr:uncharacterized protein FOA43_000832 [Brettanomyces nanus]QPG73521.1 hypothetical protein FOA43_000832 [Brettanomyces nanus]